MDDYIKLYVVNYSDVSCFVFYICFQNFKLFKFLVLKFQKPETFLVNNVLFLNQIFKIIHQRITILMIKI